MSDIGVHPVEWELRVKTGKRWRRYTRLLSGCVDVPVTGHIEEHGAYQGVHVDALSLARSIPLAVAEQIREELTE